MMIKNYLYRRVITGSYFLRLLFVMLLPFASVNVMAQTTNCSPYTQNNGSSHVTFNVQNTNGFPVIITTMSCYIGSGSQTIQILYNPTPIASLGATWSQGTLGAGQNGWVSAYSGTQTIAAAGVNTISNALSITIPAGATYGFGISSTSVSYFSLTAGAGVTSTGAGGVNILQGDNISWGGATFPATPVNYPRGWQGCLVFIPAGPCTDPPTPGNVTSTSNPVCPNTNFTLGLTGLTGGTGQTYQWESSPDGIVPYANVSGATSSTLTTTQTTSNYYRCQVTCGANSVASAGLQVVTTAVPISGTVTINSTLPTSGTNYQTFNALAAQLACGGINGPLTVNVVTATGPYTEQVSFSPIPGSSLTNTITINGNSNTVTFAATLSTAPHTIVLNGADFMTWNNVTVAGTGATYAMPMHLWNQADNNNFNNCTFNCNANGTSTTQVPFSLSGSATSATTAGVSGNNNILNGCTMFSGYYNTCIVGNSAANITGNQVLNCNLRDYYFYGAYNLYSTGTIWRGNTIERPTRTTLSTFYGCYVSTGVLGMVFEKNRIRNPFGAAITNTGTAYGVYNFIAATAGNENKFYNNVISDFKSNGAVYGMYLSGASYIKVYHNTIAFDHTTSTSTSTHYGIYNPSATAGIDIRNNIITMSQGGAAIRYGMYLSLGTTICNNNDILVNGATGTNNHGFFNVAFGTFTAWKTANGAAWDQNSVSVNPGYTNPATYDYTPTSGVVNNVGANVGVTTDINGAVRSAATPDPGAYEYTLVGLDAAIAYVSPTSPAAAGFKTITVNISNTQTATITDLTLSYNAGAGPVTEVFSGLNIATGGNQNISFATQYNLVSSVTMTVSIVDVNLGADAVAGNNTATYNLCVGMSGVYTINSGVATGGTNYQTFAAAVSALSCGIFGPVTFNVVAATGPYTEQIDIPQISGATSVNTVTFNGNGNTLTFTSASSALPSTLSFSGADYVTVNNLIVAANGATYAFACHLYNNSDNNAFNNCTFNCPANGTSSSQVPFSISGSSTSATASGLSGSNNVVTSCTMYSGYYNTCFVGNSASPNTGNQLINCNIRDQYFYASYNLYQNGMIIRGNTLERTTRTTLSTYYGIYMSTGCTNMLVEKNRIRKTWDAAPASTGTQYSIYLTSSATVGNENKIYNNLISDINFAGTIYGIYAPSYDNWRAWHNTFSFDQVAATGTTTTYGIYSTGGLNNDVRNNIVSIKRGGTGTKYCVYYTNPLTVNSNYNNLYITAGATNYIGFGASTSYSTLATWQTGTAKDANSVSTDPLFSAPIAGDYSPGTGALNDIGTPLGITTDINNASRSAVTPDPGAFEFTPPSSDAAITWLSPVAPVTTGLQTITVSVTNNTANTINSLDLGYFDGTTHQTQSFTGLSIASLASQTFNFTVQYNFAGSVTMKAYVTYVDGAQDANQNNDTTAVQNICMALAGGTYTINSAVATGGGNYQTFGAAVAALSCGILGPVTFNVVAASGPYVEQVSISPVLGTSATNTVTFNGNGNTLSYAANSGSPHTFVLNGADYINVNNMIMEGTDATYALVCHLWNTADNNTFTNCTFNAPANGTSSSQVPFSISGSATSATTSGASGSNNMITGCTMFSGYYNTCLVGNSASPATGNQVINCNIRDQYFYGIYNLYQNGAVLRGNTLERPTRTALSTFYGIYVSTGCTNMLVEKNKLRNPFATAITNTGTAYGIYSVVSATLGNENRYINNLVSDFKSSGVIYGMYVYGFSKYYHNTISLDDVSSTGASSAYGIYCGVGTNCEVRNNIVSVTRGGTGTKYCLYYSALPTASNNNGLYMAAAAGTNYIAYNGTSYATLAAWQGGTAYDAASVSDNPSYSSPGTYDYTPTSGLINNYGANLGVVTDILGTVRSVTTPDPGAYEFTPTPCSGTPAPGTTVASQNPVCAGNPYQLVLQNAFPFTGITYQWQSSPDGTTWTNISGATSATYSTTMSNSTYYQCLVTCANGGATGASTPLQVLLNTNFLNCYCVPTTTNGCLSSDHITNVTFGSIANPTGACLTASYSDYKGTVTAAVLIPGNIYTLTVEVANGGTEYAGAWIDYNSDGVFSASEFITLTDADALSPWIYTANVVVQSPTIGGITGFRVRSSYNAAIAANSACATYSYGETEDYLVNIGDPNCINLPSFPLNGGTACPNGLSLTWPNKAGATGYDVYIDGVNGSTLVSGNQLATSYTPATLPAGSYFWKVIPLYVTGSCNTPQTWTFTMNPAPDLSTSGGGVACEGNGITLSVSNNAAGQSSGNTYAWTTDASIPFTSTQQTPNVTGSSVAGHSGNYTVVVTNSFLCTASAIEAVTVNPNPTLSIVSVQNVGCVGGSDGVITVSASNGTPNYDYSADGFTTQNNTGVMTNLPTGPTTIVVLDANGCTGSITQSLTAISTVPPSAAVVVPFIGMPTSVCNGTTATLSIPAVSNTTMYIWDAPGAAYFNGNPLNVSPFTTSTPNVTVTYSNPSGSLYVTGVQAANGCGASLRKVQKTRGTISVPASVSGALTACANTVGTYTIPAVDAASSYQWTITGNATVSGTGTTATVTFGAGWTGGTLCVAAKTSCYTSPTKCIVIGTSASTLNAISGAFTACPNSTLSYSVPPSTGAASYTWTLPAGATGTSTTNSINVTYGPGYSVVGSICVSVTSVCGVTSAIKCKTVAPGLPGQPSSITGALAGLCNQTVAYSCPSQGAGVTYNWTSPGAINSGQGSTSISTTFAALSTGNVCVTASNSCGSSIARCVPVKGAPNAPGAITATPSSWCANTSGVEFTVNTSALTGSYTLNWAYPPATVATYAFGGGNSNTLILDWISGSGAVNVTASNACGSATKPSTWSSTCREGETGTVSSITVSPNPTTGLVNVNYTATKGSTVINVLDLAGRVVMTQATGSVEGVNTTQLDMSKLAKGAYMLSVQSTQGHKQIKVVVE